MRLVPISRARGILSELIRQSDNEDAVLMNHSRPAAVLISAERYDAMLDETEDLRDAISIYEREGITIPAAQLWAELGI